MVISIVNHKGGAGKTTTTINLGSALAQLGYDVLLVDLDAQGSLTYSLGIDDSESTIADVFTGDASLDEILQEKEGMKVLPGGKTLADVELSIARSDDRFFHLKYLVNSISRHDYVLIDCPPSLSLLTLNALVASDEVIIPMLMDVLSLRGLDSMLETVKKMNSINSALEVLGVLPVMIDTRKNIYNEVLNHIRSNYAIRIFDHAIRTSVKAAEAPSFGKSVVSYYPSSTTASDYRDLAQELAEITHVNQQTN